MYIYLHICTMPTAIFVLLLLLFLHSMLRVRKKKNVYERRLIGPTYLLMLVKSMFTCEHYC